MLIAYWIIGGSLALVFVVSGTTKVLQRRIALASRGMTYVNDFSDPQIKTIGALEIVGAVGLVLPGLAGVAPILGPIAALALGALMIGAVTVHIRRREAFVPPLALAALAFTTALFGFLAFA